MNEVRFGSEADIEPQQSDPSYRTGVDCGARQFDDTHRRRLNVTFVCGRQGELGSFRGRNYALYRAIAFEVLFINFKNCPTVGEGSPRRVARLSRVVGGLEALTRR